MQKNAKRQHTVKQHTDTNLKSKKNQITIPRWQKR